MHRTWNQMVIRERDPVTVTDFACIRPRPRPDGRGPCYSAHVVVEEWGEEEFGDIGGIGDEGVDG